MATISSNTVLHPVVVNEDEKKGWEDKTQRFIGIEIETTRNLNMIPKVDSIEWNACAWHMSNTEKTELGKILDPSEKMIAMIGADGDDIEIATQPMSLGALSYGGESARFFQNINRYCVGLERSGTHYHVSKKKGDHRNLWRNLYWFSMVFDKQLYAIFRRRSTWALSPKTIYKERNMKKVDITKPCKDRYPTLGNKGTIIVKRNNTYECRAGAATTSTKELIAWGKLFYNIVEFCNQKDIVGHRFEEVLPEGNYGDMLRDRLTGEQQRQIVPIDLYL